MKYTVVISQSTDTPLQNLIEEVNRKLDQGWRPQGAVQITVLAEKGMEDRFIYAQALYSDNDTLDPFDD